MASRQLGNILDDDDGDDPILSVVNIVDVFLVIIAVLLIAVIENPLSPFSALSAQSMVVIKNPGTPSMEMVVKQGKELKHYQSTGQIGEGQGHKAGVAYRLNDGTMVYVPEETPSGTPAAPAAPPISATPGGRRP